MKLGELIRQLSLLPRDAYIGYDFGSAEVTNLSSYRGDYSELALGYDGEYGASQNTVGSLLDGCLSALEKPFTGWKGGDFTMSKDTLIHVANHGCTSDTLIADIVQLYEGWYCIRTATYIGDHQ